MFPTNNLSSLHTTNASTTGFVPADSDRVTGGFNGALSPLLTVWRKLHLEIDSMTAVPTSGPQANYVSMVATAIKTNAPNPGQTMVYLRITEQPWQTNRYENGTLSIAGSATNYPIIGQGAERIMIFDSFQNYVVVAGIVPPNLSGAMCQLRDDDRLKGELQLPSLPMDGFSQQIINGKQQVFSTNKVRGAAAVYRPAFIEVVDANAAGWNPRRTIPFFLNKDVFYPLTMTGVFDGAQDLVDSQIFWAHTATFGYQPDFSEDRDNNDEAGLLGTTQENPFTAVAFGYSAIYEETIRDHAYDGRASNYYLPLNYKLLEQSYYGWLFGTIAHEIGHAPGNGFETYTDHAESHLMQKGGDEISKDFAPASIKRFRTSISWRAGAP